MQKSIKYGVKQSELKQYRDRIKRGQSFGYCMAQLELTYKVRRVMYGVREQAKTEV